MMGESRYPPNPAHGDRIHQYSEVSFENTSSRGLNSQPNSTNIFKSIFSRLREQYERVVPKISRWKSQSLASLGHSRSTSTLGRNNHSTANTIEMKARHNRVSSLRPLPNRPNGELKLRAHLRKPSGPRHLPHLATIDAKAVVAIQQLQPISEEELFEISENSNLLEIIKRMKFNLVQLENHAISGKDKDLENHSLEISLIIEFIRIGYEELKALNNPKEVPEIPNETKSYANTIADDMIHEREGKQTACETYDLPEVDEILRLKLKLTQLECSRKPIRY